MSLMELTAVELGKKIQAGEISAVEAVQESLARTRALEERVHAFVNLDEANALQKAAKVQAQPS